MKQVLVIYFTQTGQQKEIVDSVVSSMKEDSDIELTYYKITPQQKFPFPWNKKDFFNLFPETFLQIPMELEQEEIPQKEYDLIILSYQIWFLSPSRPVNSFLQSKEAEKLFKNKPVITIIGCRNMWVMAQEKMKKRLVGLQARLVGNMVFTDRQSNHVSLITLLHWLFKGEKNSYLGIFPKPGVPDKDINEAAKFGVPIRESLKSNDYTMLQEKLLNLKAVVVKPLLIFIEKRGTLIFSKWAKFIHAKKNDKRLFWLKVFYYYLFIALWLVAPVVTLIFNLIYLPTCFLYKKSNNYYKSISLKS